MNSLNDQKIIDSWHQNVEPWTCAVRENQIESRKLVTNQAIVDAVLSVSPKSVIDIGCGEGWLVRALVDHVTDVLGIDAIPGLIQQAQQAGCGRYQLMSYEDIAAGHLQETFDGAVCNFSLLGKDSVEGLFRRMPQRLNKDGVFIVQTIHPVLGCGEQPYQDGWIEGSWQGFSEQFTDPAPWYFRTIESWIRLFNDNGFRLKDFREPIHPVTHKAASIILIGQMSK